MQTRVSVTCHFFHTAILMLQKQKASGKFVVIGMGLRKSFSKGLSPLALFRPLVGSWTVNNTTPSHHWSCSST